MKYLYLLTHFHRRYPILIFMVFINVYLFGQGNRSIDGWLNNPQEIWGATFTNVAYRSPVTYGDGLTSPTGKDRPNPRHISSMLFSQQGLVSDPNGLNALVWVWGQFIDHDITLSPDHPQESFPIPVPAFDPYFDPAGTGTAVIPMLRSDYDRTTGALPGNPRKHYNATTAFIDGSGVYGPDQSRADYLRTFTEGKLRTSRGKLLPYNTLDGELESDIDPQAPEMAMPFPRVKKYYVAGDVRANENPLLTTIHTLFVREHNRYCDAIQIQHPDWNDEQLYQKARKWVGALIEAVVYEEWLPLMGIELPAYTGYDPKVNPSIMNEFSVAAYRYGHTTITPTLIRLDPEGLPHEVGDIALRDAFFNPTVLTSDLGIEPYLMGATTSSQQHLDCKVIDELRNFLFGQPGAGGLDLVALNINRGRDRGLMDYNHLRTYFSLPLLESFEQMTSDPIMQAGLEEVFGDVNKIDAWVGMLAEDHVKNSMFGATAYSIILDQFSTLRAGDRFYYEADSEISADEKTEIKGTRLSDIIRRNGNLSLFPDEAFKVWTFEPDLNRTITGLSNNLYNPDWGASGAKVISKTASAFFDGVAQPSGPERPNARKISNQIFAQTESINDVLNLSAYAWGWGQFIDHDITLSPDHSSERLDISIPAFDAFFDPDGTGDQTMPMHRSDYIKGTGTNRANPRAYYNGITAYIDASAVYGSDEQRAFWLRSFKDGKLKVSTGDHLPYNTLTGEAYDPKDPNAPEMAMPFPHVDRFFVAGDVRANENPFLTSIHTLFVREHNRLCDEIKHANPEWLDEDIYQYARKMVGGQIESIVYNEWLPTLGVDIPEYRGYNPATNPGIMNIFSTAAYRYGHSTIGTDFVMMDGQGNYLPGGENMALRQLFFNPGFIAPSTGGIEGFLAGMSTVHTQEFDCHVIDDLRNFLFGPPGAGGLDLVALNINRGRDRGLADYNTVRAEFGMPKITSFNQLSSDPLLNQHFATVYSNVDHVDPWAGMLAEEHMNGSLFGITAQTILKHQFTSLRDGDRFFFEVDPVLTPQEKANIRNTRLADVIRRNTSIEFIQDNIFELPEQTTANVDLLVQTEVKVYPNPASDHISISYSEPVLFTKLQKIEITDLSGKMLLTQHDIDVSNQGNLIVNIGNLPSQGMYLLHTWTSQGHFSTKFLKL